jgi:hypothetical protein
MTNINSNNKVEKETAEIQSIIKETQKDTCIFMLVVLQSIINEQITAKQLDKAAGKYIYNAVKDQCIRKRFIA